MTIRQILWHSGLLLILLCTTIRGHRRQLRIGNVSVPNGGHYVIPAGVNRIDIQCDIGESLNSKVTFSWFVDGIELGKGNGNLKLDVLGETRKRKVECFAEFREIRSYAFIYVIEAGKLVETESQIAATFAQVPEEIRKVTIGDDLALKCSLNNENEFSIRWLRNGVEIQDETESKLILSSVTESASYGCLIYHNINPIAYKEVIVVSISRPKITSEYTNPIFVLSGDNLELVCETNPETSVEWIPLTDINEITRYSKTLNLSDIVTNSEWTCVATNEIGERDSKTVRIRAVTPNTIEYRNFSPNLTLDCGEALELSSKEGEIRWYGGNSELPERSTLKSIRTEGNYTCVLVKDEDIVIGAALFVVGVGFVKPVVTPFPDDDIRILSGKSITVLCDVKGSPNPSVTWSFNGKVIMSQNSILSIVDADKNRHSGQYSCEAQNAFGRDSKSLFLSVLTPIEDFKNDTVIVKNAGQPFQLPCNVTSLDNVDVSKRWITKDGAEIDQYLLAQPDSIVIPYLRLENSGTYICSVETPLERSIIVRKLQVRIEKPKIAMIETVETVIGRYTEIPCNVTGIPNPQVYWKRDGVKVTDGSILVLENPGRINDGQSFVCGAVNEYGSDQKSLALRVYNSTKIISPSINTIMTTEIGKDVTLRCEVEFDSRFKSRNVVVVWRKKNDVTKTVTDDWQRNEQKIILRNISKSDEATYICIVSSPLDSVNRTIKLSVLSEAPSFLSTEKDVRTLEGSDVTVSCQANGLPIPKISWKKTDRDDEEDHERWRIGTLGDLTIFDVQLEDQGLYICTATNVYGQISTESTVEVIRRSKKSSVNTVIKTVRENVILVCDVVYDPRLREETKVTWTKDGSTIEIKGPKFKKVDETSIEIRELEVIDQGTYECVVKTPFETVTSSTSLVLSGKPPTILSEFRGKVIINEGEELRLSCRVQGVPLPTLTWYFQDSPLANGENVVIMATTSELENSIKESEVVVKNVSEADEGVYQCRADNDYGSGVAKFSRVRIVGRTRVAITPNDISVHAGTSLKIPCRVVVDPDNRITDIRWSTPFPIRALDRVDFGIDGSIRIGDVQRRHSGKYSCHVTTAMDNATASVDVTVTVNAPFIAAVTKDKTIFDGESLTLSCNANGIPEPTVSWNFNQTETHVKDGVEFEILNAIASDSGSYECIARNPYGETRRTIRVSVVHTPGSIKNDVVSVKKGKSVTLPCVKPRPGTVFVKWTYETDHDNLLSFDARTGELQIDSVNEKNIGTYICTVTLQGGEMSRSLIKYVKLKPDIILQESNTFVEITEGQNLTLGCNVLPGIGAKRLWKHGDTIIIPGGNREVSNRGSLLTIESIRPDSDAGNYICTAFADFGRDTIEYTVKVNPVMPLVSDKIEEVSCNESRSNGGISISDVVISNKNNDTVIVRWTYPTLFNSSCYEDLVITWWTNKTNDDGESRFVEESVPLPDTETYISGLDFVTGYFVQVNLREKNKRLISGSTFSFNLADLSPVVDLNTGNSALSSGTLLGIDSPSIVILISVLLVLLFLSSVLALLYYKNKLCQKKKKKPFGGTEFRDFQLIQTPPRGIDDFMQNLTPQWPEPVEPPSTINNELDDPDQDEETRVFIKSQQQQYNNHNNKHPSKNNSISSSWSSLFNLPIEQRPQQNKTKVSFGSFVT